MGLVREPQARADRAAMGVLREDVPKDELLNPSYQYVPLEDIAHRAGAFGYQVEEFWLGRAGLTPERVQRILQARGIEAVIVSPAERAIALRQGRLFALRGGGVFGLRPCASPCCTGALRT